MIFRLTNKPVRSWHLLVLTGVLTLFVQGASAATYYVATTGSDSNPGTQSAPFRHLTKAAATATQPGDTVIIMDGTYDNEGVVAPNVVVILYYSGTAGNPITFRAQNRGKAILDSMNSSTTTSCDGASAYFGLKSVSFIVIQGFVIQREIGGGTIAAGRRRRVHRIKNCLAAILRPERDRIARSARIIADYDNVGSYYALIIIGAVHDDHYVAGLRGSRRGFG